MGLRASRMHYLIFYVFGCYCCLVVEVMANHLVRQWLPAKGSLLSVCCYFLVVYMFSTGKQIIKTEAYKNMFVYSLEQCLGPRSGTQVRLTVSANYDRNT